MCLLKKKKSEPEFFNEDRMDAKFDETMTWVKELSRKDYNKLKKAMDLDYNAYQTLHGIDDGSDTSSINEPEFMLHPDEGK